MARIGDNVSEDVLLPFLVCRQTCDL